MNHMLAVLEKQVKDTLKNKTVFIQFIMFPVLTLIMENTVKIEGMPAHFFANLFAVMYIGMAPLTAMAAIISEEKEKNTLRVLLMSNVSPIEYLFGIGSYIWTICMAGAFIIGLGGKYYGAFLLRFLLIMAVGILISVLLGAVIGIRSKNQMAATSITVPVMMIFSFLPMLSMFNEAIEKIAQVTYSYRLHMLMNQMENGKISAESLVVIGLNMVVAMVLFGIVYRREGLAK